MMQACELFAKVYSKISRDGGQVIDMSGHSIDQTRQDSGGGGRSAEAGIDIS
jgi:hypothetical protein